MQINFAKGIDKWLSYGIIILLKTKEKFMDYMDDRGTKIKKIIETSKLKNKKYVEKLRKMSDEELCKMFNCRPEQICRGNYVARLTDDKVCPYVVVLGYVNAAASTLISLGDLAFVGIGEFDSGLDNQGLILSNSYITSSGKVKYICGSYIMDAKTKYVDSMGEIEYIGGNCYMNRTPITSMGKVKEIGGILSLDESNVKTLQGVEKIGVIYAHLANRLQSWGTTLKQVGDVKFEYQSITMRRNPEPSTLDIHDKFYDIFSKNSSGNFERNEIKTSYEI